MNVVVTSVLPPKIGVVTRDRVAVDGDVDVVGEHRAVELDRQAGHHVAALVGLREHDQVGRVAAVDHGLHRRRHGDAGQLAAEIAGGVHLGRAVLAERAGDGRRVAADEARVDRRRALRALVSSSSVPVVGAPLASCAKTQMFMMLLR